MSAGAQPSVASQPTTNNTDNCKEFVDQQKAKKKVKKKSVRPNKVSRQTKMSSEVDNIDYLHLHVSVYSHVFSVFAFLEHFL